MYCNIVCNIVNSSRLYRILHFDFDQQLPPRARTVSGSSSAQISEGLGRTPRAHLRTHVRAHLRAIPGCYGLLGAIKGYSGLLEPHFEGSRRWDFWWN